MPRRPRILTLAMGLLVLAVACWLALRGVAVTREFTATIAFPAGDAHWSLRWTPPARPGIPSRPNGCWIDPASFPGEETLEIRVSGTPHTSGRTFRLWLYEVAPSDAPPLDLHALALPPGNAGSKWLAIPGGPGIVYDTNAPAVLRLPIRAGSVRLGLARTPDGGPVTIAFGGAEQTLDLWAEKDTPTQVTLSRARPPAGLPVPLRARLPNYPMHDLALAWTGPAPGPVAIANPRVQLRVLGVLVGDEPLGVAGAAPAQGSFSVTPASPDAQLDFSPPPGVPLLGHALGVAAALGVLAGLMGVAVLVVRRARVGCYRWLTPQVGAILAVVLVRAWMVVWAPLLYCPDSMDYMLGAIRFAEHGTLDRFNALRVPGYAVLLGAVWTLEGDFNLKLGIVQAMMGVATAVLAWDMSRRVLPRAWAVLVLLLVGLCPGLLTWERFAMSEAPSAFLMVLGLWLVARRGGWDLAGDRRRLGGALAYAALVGVVCTGAIYVRANLQLLLIVLPALAAAECWRRWGAVRALLIGAVLLAAGVGTLAPRLLKNRAETGRAAVIPAEGWMVGLLSWRTHALDENQTVAFDYPTWERLHRARAQGLGDYGFASEYIVPASSIPVRADVPPYLVANDRLDYLVRESFPRQPERRLRGAGDALVSLLGVRPWADPGNVHEHDFWSRPLRNRQEPGQKNYWNPGDLDGTPEVRVLRDRTLRDIPASAVRHAVAFDAAFNFDYQLARPFLALLMLLGSCVAAWKRQPLVLAAAALAWGNTIALAWLIQCGIDRYAIPFEPMNRLIAVYALWQMSLWLARGRGAPSAARTP